MSLAIDTSHGCRSGGGVRPGVVPVQQKASSACCGAKLALAESTKAALAAATTEEEYLAVTVAYTCKDCGQPAAKVLAQPVAHWTCVCGVKRSQVITTATDEAGA